MTKWMDETMYWKQLHSITSATGTPTTGIFTIPICKYMPIICSFLSVEKDLSWPSCPVVFILSDSVTKWPLSFRHIQLFPALLSHKIAAPGPAVLWKGKGAGYKNRPPPTKDNSLDCTLRKQSTLACPSDLHHLPRSLLLLTNRCCVVCRGLLATELKMVTRVLFKIHLCEWVSWTCGLFEPSRCLTCHVTLT